VRHFAAGVLAFAVCACSSANEKGASAVAGRLRAKLDAEACAHPPADASFASMARLAAAVNEQASLAKMRRLCPDNVAFSLSAVPGKVGMNATCDGASAPAEWAPA
jgi:hypothetical protein